MGTLSATVTAENPRTANPPPGRLGHVPALDGLRGLAILFVLGNHTPLRSCGAVLPGGFIGVDLFFVLSGFLITTLLLEEWDCSGTISLRDFYLRRVLRLGPALVAMLLVFCCLSFVLYDSARARSNCHDALIALFYASNWVRVFTHNQLGLLAHTWSLSVEEQFYLLWPVILWGLLRFARRRYQVVLFAVGVTLASWALNAHLALKLPAQRRLWLHLCFGSDSRVGTLMVGCILGVVLSSGLLNVRVQAALRRGLVIGTPLSLACLVAFSLYAHLVMEWFFYCGFALVSLLAAVLVLEVRLRPQSLFARLLSLKGLVWVGAVSYGLYLWHWPIFWGMHGFKYSGWTVLLVGTPVTLLVVSLSYYFLEKPLLELKQRFSHSGSAPAGGLMKVASAYPGGRSDGAALTGPNRE